ncbi:MAG: 16S rRNA (cytidine(1402)-2'-O)-methyltransferase [Ruminococcaceae bacterium]|nr:16S rRNA (cytidine(1402)-2'-O)-methyltransferase [Oscillospiraceae bacterium]
MLYVVATPIGNLGDISQRALEVLKNCDVIAAEDTRHTQKLLMHFGIKKPLISYYEHNKTVRGPVLIEKLVNGENIALVSDAGTPGISDPGADLIKAATDAGLEVSMIPGPVAGITALVLSGLPTDKFVFEGFIGTDNKKKQEFADMIVSETRTVIIYEAPHRLVKTLEFLANYIGERKVAVCRELTKSHEEILRGTVASHIAHFSENEPRGEFVLVIEGADKKTLNEETVPTTAEDIFNKFNEIAESDKASGIRRKKNDIIKDVAAYFNLPKNKVYDMYEEVNQQTQGGL